MGPTARRDIIFSLTFGVICLLFFHLDHLVVTYSGWNDPYWLLHVVVDSGYIWVYGALAWIGLRGWRVWKRRVGEQESGRAGDGEMGRVGEREMGRWGDGEMGSRR